MTHYTFLVKSEKYGNICLACLDESNRWIRPIKPGGFTETDIIMDNEDVIDIFDVVDVEFGPPRPIKHHKENVEFVSGCSIKFVKKLSETERIVLLQQVANSQLLNKVESKDELYDEIINSGCSLVLVGPIDSFDITYGKHPKLWIIGKNEEELGITCTDFKFSAFIESKSADFKNDPRGYLSSQDITELKSKQIYFVIGLTGDHLDENNEIINGKYAPMGASYAPRYWPLVVSVLTIPSYSSED